MALSGDNAEPQKVTGAKVSDNLFALLQVQPNLGRTFADGESTPGRDRVVVLSDRLWRQQFAADPAVLGRVVLVDQAPYEVIGVMPATFELFGRESDLWVPIPFAPGTPGNRTTFSLAIGRLRARRDGRVRIGRTDQARARDAARACPASRLGPDDSASPRCTRPSPARCGRR